MDISIFKELYPFDGCDDDDLTAILPYFEEIKVKEGKSVYMEGEPAEYVFVIQEGLVEMSKYNDFEEKEYHLGVLSHADLFGNGEVFFEEYYINTKAVNNVRLLRMKKADFFEHLLNVPALNTFVLKSFAYIIRQRISMIDWHSALGKISYYIFFLCNEYGIMKKDRILIDHKITHEKIAGILNLSREHISRLLSQMVKDEIIDKSSSGLTVDRVWYEEKLNDQKFNISFRRSFQFEPEE